MNYSIKRSVLALALFGAVGAANASVLNVSVPTTSVDIVAGSFGGTLLDSAVSAISTPGWSGTARTAVYKNDLGTLDFYYQFSNNASSATGIERFATFNYGTLGNTAFNVYQTSAAFGVFTAGTEVSDNADRSASVVGFSFVPNGSSKIYPGTTSFTQIIRTDAKGYTSGNFGILDGYSANAVAFAPLPVPEPESFAMLLAGLGLMGTIARRRTRKPS